MAIGLCYGVEPSPGSQRDEEPRHLRAAGDIFLMENTVSDGKMAGIFKKVSKIFQQTCALLWKNILLVWRMKTENFQEWITSGFFVLLIFISSRIIYSYPRQDIPYAFLGRLDDPAFNATGFTVLYTPVTNTTRQIMSKVSLNSTMTGVKIEGVENENNLFPEGNFVEDLIGVVFKDDFSYRLRFDRYRVVSPSDIFDRIGNKINETTELAFYI